jgi:hypothetical protein
MGWVDCLIGTTTKRNRVGVLFGYWDFSSSVLLLPFRALLFFSLAQRRLRTDHGGP